MLQSRCLCAIYVTALLAFWPSNPVIALESYGVKVTVTAPETDTRDQLSIEDLAQPAGGAQAVHNEYFLPIGSDTGPGDPIEGTLHLDGFTITHHNFTAIGSLSGTTNFPGISVQIIARGGVFLPVERDQFLTSDGADWDIILGSGRSWTEPGDQGWSRVSFPFTLVWRDAHRVANGVATFAYNGAKITNLRLQIGQDGAPSGPKLNFHSQVKLRFTPGPVDDADAELAKLRDERGANFPVQPWTALETLTGKGPLTGFDPEPGRPDISAGGLLVGDTIYLRSCATRFGPYPYCGQLRHSVFSVSKSLGAGIAMLRLAERYGPSVFNERILDHVTLHAPHEGWSNVTFGDALNMATGIGNLTPYRVDHYVDTDGTQNESLIWSVPTVQSKLLLISGYQNYPWEPGEVLRYKSSETMLLSIAMDRFIRAHEGSDYGLWDLLTDDVYKPLSLRPIPTRMAFDKEAEVYIPRFDGGMFPTFQEALRLARLLADGGVYQGRQILHADMTGVATDTSLDRGLGSGWFYAEGGEATYEMSLWLAPFQTSARCYLRVPAMSGYGGNYVLIMPNDTIGFRFADSPDNANWTYDSSGIRKVSHKVRPFCD